MTSTTVEYSKSESDKKSDALISSTENQYQDELEDDDLEDDSEEFSYGYRGRQILDAAGDKSNEGSVRPPKKVKNDNKGDTAGEGGSANEGAGNNKFALRLDYD